MTEINQRAIVHTPPLMRQHIDTGMREGRVQGRRRAVVDQINSWLTEILPTLQLVDSLMGTRLDLFVDQLKMHYFCLDAASLLHAT